MSKTRRETILERLHGKPAGVDQIIQIWNDDCTNTLLRYVWQAYDRLYAYLLYNLDWKYEFDDLERSITRELERAIHDELDGFLPYTVQHAPPEHESRQLAPARPPEYDIAFVWRADPRIMWPLEAKVLKTDRSTETNLGDYTTTVKERFLTCYYAPFSNGGAMVCYLKTGNSHTLLENIATSLQTVLEDHPHFPDRHHKISQHLRNVPHGKAYPVQFRCHHMVFPLGGY